MRYIMLRRTLLILVGVIVVCASAARAQQLTPAQQTTLKAFILADPTLNSFPNTLDGSFAIAEALNSTAVPDFWVYKTFVSIRAIGDNINGSELAGLTSLNNTRLQTVALFSSEGIDPSLTDRRAFFDDIFSGAGGTQTRANLAVLWRRLANRVEKLFATGVGSTASPAKMSFEGQLTYQTVYAVRNLP